MSQPFIGEIRAFGFTFPPVGWAFCGGQLLAIAQFQALFAVIGTIYGGNGQSTFALPDLQERGAMNWGDGPGLSPRVIGEYLGSQTVTLTEPELPHHSHTIRAADANTATQSIGTPVAEAFLGRSNPGAAYGAVTPGQPLSPKAIGGNGGGQSHNNLQPFLTLNFCIALDGLFPSRN